MTKILAINGIWTSIVFGMLAASLFLYGQGPRFVSGGDHLASLQDSMKGATSFSVTE